MKIAITGNIGAGKSALEEILVKKGFDVIDADKIAHDVLEKELPGISRETLAKIAFSNDFFKCKLEALIHPQVAQIIKETDAQFVAVPLLFESNMQNLFDKIILVTAPEDVRLKRILTRGYTLQHAKNRMAAQLAQEEKIAKSDFIIENNGTIEQLETAIEKLLPVFTRTC